MACCLIGSIIPLLHAQTYQRLVEHDTVKARRYFERGMALKDDLGGDSVVLYLEKAVELFEINSNWLESINSYLELGKHFQDQNQYWQALIYYEKANEISSKNLEEHLIQGSLSQNIGTAFIKMGKYDSAEQLFKKSLGIFRKQEGDSSSNVASCYYYLGWLNTLKGEYELALEFSEEALKIKKFLRQTKNLVSSLNIIGAIHYFKADYSKARHFWEQGLNQSQNFKKVVSRDNPVLMIYKNLGSVEFQQGNYKKAMETYMNILEQEKSYYGSENTFTAGTHFNIAEVSLEQENYNEAIKYFNESLRIYQKVLGLYHPEIVEVYEKLGNVYWKQGNRQKALIQYNHALRLNEITEGIPEFSASLYKQLGEVHLEMESFDSSEFYFTRSSGILYELFGQKHPEIAEIHLKLALLEKSQFRWEQALKECQEGLNSVVNDEDLNPFESQNIHFVTKGIDVLYTYAQYLSDAYLENYGEIGNLKKALNYIELAIELIQQKRILVFDQKAQRDFSKRYAPVYEQGLRIALLLHQETDKAPFLETAFQMMEGSRAFTLNQSTQNRQEPIAYSLPDSLLEKERSLKVDISFYEEEILDRKSDQGGYDTALVKSYEDKLFYRKRDFDLLKQRLKQDYPKYHQLKYRNHTLNLSELKQSLSDEELLIEYLWQEDFVTIMAVTDQALSYERVPIDQTLLDQLTSMNSAFDQPKSTLSIETYAKLSNAVFQKLVTPALSIAGSKTSKLIIIPDGPLAQLNFDLLVQNHPGTDTGWKDLPYMIKDYAIATGYSASLFFDVNPSSPPSPNGLLAFSFGEKGEIRAGDHLTLDKVRSADLTSLPGSAKEIKTISELVQGDYYYGQQASEQTFKEVASDYQILHLALHGSVDEENPDFSKLHLHSRDTTEDGRLHVYELYNMELNADLAVLSACNTGSGKYQTGEGIMSLGHAFSYAGVNSLLLTRWDLSDESAPEIMKVFYRELMAGKSKSEALRTAKLEYLESASIFRSNPFYWGSFFVLGSDSAVRLGTSNRNLNHGILWSAFLLIVALLIRRKFKA